MIDTVKCDVCGVKPVVGGDGKPRISGWVLSDYRPKDRAFCPKHARLTPEQRLIAKATYIEG